MSKQLRERCWRFPNVMMSYPPLVPEAIRHIQYETIFDDIVGTEEEQEDQQEEPEEEVEEFPYQKRRFLCKRCIQCAFQIL